MSTPPSAATPDIRAVWQCTDQSGVRVDSDKPGNPLLVTAAGAFAVALSDPQRARDFAQKHECDEALSLSRERAFALTGTDYSFKLKGVKKKGKESSRDDKRRQSRSEFAVEGALTERLNTRAQSMLDQTITNSTVAEAVIKNQLSALITQAGNAETPEQINRLCVGYCILCYQYYVDVCVKDKNLSAGIKSCFRAGLCELIAMYRSLSCNPARAGTCNNWTQQLIECMRAVKQSEETLEQGIAQAGHTFMTSAFSDIIQGGMQGTNVKQCLQSNADLLSHFSGLDTGDKTNFSRWFAEYIFGLSSSKAQIEVANAEAKLQELSLRTGTQKRQGAIDKHNLTIKLHSEEAELLADAEAAGRLQTMAGFNSSVIESQLWFDWRQMAKLLILVCKDRTRLDSEGKGQRVNLVQELKSEYLKISSGVKRGGLKQEPDSKSETDFNRMYFKLLLETFPISVFDQCVAGRFDLISPQFFESADAFGDIIHYCILHAHVTPAEHRGSIVEACKTLRYFGGNVNPKAAAVKKLISVAQSPFSQSFLSELYQQQHVPLFVKLVTSYPKLLSAEELRAIYETCSDFLVKNIDARLLMNDLLFECNINVKPMSLFSLGEQTFKAIREMFKGIHELILRRHYLCLTANSFTTGDNADAGVKLKDPVFCDFDFSSHDAQFLAALNICLGFVGAFLEIDGFESEEKEDYNLKLRNELYILQHRLTAIGQKHLINTQPFLKEGKVFGAQFFVRPKTRRMVVNTDVFQKRGGKWLFERDNLMNPKCPPAKP